MEAQRQISNEELLALTKKAFEQDEVAEFLCGEKGYGVHGNRDIPANIPTDFGRIVEKGIYVFYEQTKNEDIISKTKKALIKLINGTPVNVWVAFMIMRRQLSKREKNVAALIFDDVNTLLLLKDVLYAYEPQLKKCKEFLGADCENGLWQDILRVENNYKENMGVSIL